MAINGETCYRRRRRRKFFILPPRPPRKLKFFILPPRASRSSPYRILPPSASLAGNRFSGIILAVHESMLNLSHTTSASLPGTSLQEETMQGPRAGSTRLFTGKTQVKIALCFISFKYRFMIFAAQNRSAYRFGTRLSEYPF